MRSSGVLPDWLRSSSSPSSGTFCMLGGPEALGLLELLALGVDDDAGQAVAVACRRMRVTQRSLGSCTWPSAETMKNLSAASGRAERSQPSLPGVSRRQTFWASGSGSTVVMGFPLVVDRWLVSLREGAVAP